MERVEIAVVGAGVMGSAAARALAARGVPAVLLEQFELGHARGSSHGANRIFRCAYPDPVYVRMAVAARGEWLRLQDEAGEQLLMTTGSLDAGRSAELCAAAMSECGVPNSWLTEGDVRERFAGIAPRPGERMLWHEGGVLLAERAVAALQRLTGRDGASLRPMTPVLGLEPRCDGVLLRTPDGEIGARVAIVTAGGWTGGLLGPALSLLPPLTVTLQQVHYYAAADPGARWPTFIEWSNGSHGWYAVPVAGGAPGVKVARHHPGRPVDPRTGPFTKIDPVLADAAARYTSERLPGLLPTALHAETCLYTMTADQDFVLDRAGPIVVGGGGSGHAFKFGPLLGQILADLALGKDVSIPRDRFSLSRAAPG